MSAEQSEALASARQMRSIRAPWTRRDWTFLAALSVLAILVMVPGVFCFGIIDPSDGLYTEGAREMRDLHETLTPYVNYQPFYEKPILIYWAILAAFKLFGVSPGIARLPSAISSVLCVCSMFALTRREIGSRAAFISALILLASPFFAVVGHLALTDSMLTLFVTVATLCFFERLRGGGIALLAIAYGCLGLAVLAKGPVALLLVGATFCAYFFMAGKIGGESWLQFIWRQMCRLHPLAGLALVALIAAPWYVAECSATHGEFFQEFFIRQNLGRATGAVNHQNSQIYYYLPFLFGGMLPWWLVLLAAPKVVADVWRKRRHEGSVRQLSLLCLCWTALVVVLFSVLRTKLPTYILPAFPPIAILTGVAVETMLVTGRKKPLLVVATVIAGISAFAALVLPFVFMKVHGVSLSVQLVSYAGVTLLAIGFVACVLLLSSNRRQSAMYSATVCSALAVALLIPAGLHQYDKKQHRPFRDLLFRIDKEEGNAALFLRDSPAASFYLTRRIPMITSQDDLQTWKSEKQGKHFLLLTPDVLYLARERLHPLNLVEQGGKWSLFRVD